MKLLTQKLEQEKGIFREPVKKPKSFPVWMRGNTTRPLERMISKGGTKIIDEQDKMQRSPLYLAAKYNNLEVVTTLMKEGAKVGTRDHQYKTPLMSAVINGNIDITKYFFTNYYNNQMNELLRMTDGEKRNIFHFAILSGNNEIIKIVLHLLKLNKQILEKLLTGRDAKGNCPFHLA